MPSADAQRLRGRLNNLPIIAAGSLYLGPMSIFWMRFVPALRPFHFDIAPPPPLYVFAALTACMVPFILPHAYFRPKAWERGRFYPRLGLGWFRLLAPDGGLINAKLRRLNPNYKVIRTRADLRDHIRGTYSNERRHSALFIAGLLTGGFALAVSETPIAVLLLAGNVAFNLYPVMHQRYKRARVHRLVVKDASGGA